jgi:hypothetical protein
MRYRVLPVLGIVAAGFANTLLPRDVVGLYDVASRAAVTGAVAAVTVTSLLLLTRRKRPDRPLR